MYFKVIEPYTVLQKPLNQMQEPYQLYMSQFTSFSIHHQIIT